jgi:hypothetical protein
MIHVLIFRNVPCDVEPEIFGDAKCRKALLGDSMCDVVCTSGKPFYARLLPDLLRCTPEKHRWRPTWHTSPRSPTCHRQKPSLSRKRHPQVFSCRYRLTGMIRPVRKYL